LTEARRLHSHGRETGQNALIGFKGALMQFELGNASQAASLKPGTGRGRDLCASKASGTSAEVGIQEADLPVR
jgi:hypothetical protein